MKRRVITLEEHVERMLTRMLDRSEAQHHRNAGIVPAPDHQAERERQEREEYEHDAR